MKKNKCTDIVITEEMLNAGIEILANHEPDDQWEWTVKRIYEAMTKFRP